MIFPAVMHNSFIEPESLAHAVNDKMPSKLISAQVCLMIRT